MHTKRMYSPPLPPAAPQNSARENTDLMLRQQRYSSFSPLIMNSEVPSFQRIVMLVTEESKAEMSARVVFAGIYT